MGLNPRSRSRNRSRSRALDGNGNWPQRGTGGIRTSETNIATGAWSGDRADKNALAHHDRRIAHGRDGSPGRPDRFTRPPRTSHNPAVSEKPPYLPILGRRASPSVGAAGAGTHPPTVKGPLPRAAGDLRPSALRRSTPQHAIARTKLALWSPPCSIRSRV